jgi:hypothetical protein
VAAERFGRWVTITRVTMETGATSPRHSHPKSEQTWIVEQGTATLLLANEEAAEMRAGDVVRTPPGEDEHGRRPVRVSGGDDTASGLHGSVSGSVQSSGLGVQAHGYYSALHAEGGADQSQGCRDLRGLTVDGARHFA